MLHQLHQGFDLKPVNRFFLGSGVGEHESTAQVRVVRYGEYVTARIRLEALCTELAPEFGDRAVGIKDGNREARHFFAFENHVSVQVGHLLALGVLVSYESSEAAVLRAIVMALSSLLNVIPYVQSILLAIAQRANDAALRRLAFHAA